MYSETGMLEDCQQIYSHYLTDAKTSQSGKQMIIDIDTMLRQISAVIDQKSEKGINTIFLEKIRTDLNFIRSGVTG